MLPQELMQLMEDVACYNHPFECSIDQGKDRKRATKQLEDLVGITDAKSCVGSGVALGTRAAGCAWTAANLLPFILKGVGKAGMLMRAGKAGNIGDLPKSMQVAIKGGDFCSFGGDTRVLMANGSTKKISKIKVGDRVAAADPLTGKRGSFRVTALWVHDDKLVALTAPGIFLATTADHPFWNASAKKWQRADTLAASGGRLLTFRGREIPVRAGALKPIRTGRAFNFTVAHLHTYYVMAGKKPVLVHNCGGAGRDLIDGEAQYHIITGNRTGGGHKWPGQPGKTVFPQSWDTNKILDGVADVATNPTSTRTWQTGAQGSLYTRKGDPSRVKIEGVYDGVQIQVIFEPATDRIITGFPIG
jgi:hypothetical protein